MTRVLAKVSNGRLVVDAPTDLPEGSAVQLVIVDSDPDADDLTDAERVRREASIARGIEDMQHGKVVPAADVLARLAAR